MTQRSYTHPDPDTQPGFYDSMPSKRFFAWIIDTVLIAILCSLILPLTLFTGIFFFAGLMLVVGFAYRVLTLAGGSATWGMRLVGIEFRTQSGERFDFGAALLHTIGYSVSWSFPLLQVISVLLMLGSRKKQGLTDHIMGSVAINRSARH